MKVQNDVYKTYLQVIRETIVCKQVIEAIIVTYNFKTNENVLLTCDRLF